MSRLTRPTILCFTFALSTASTAVLTTSCAQPILTCRAAPGYFAAEYTLTSGDANSACGQLIGDVLGMNTYAQEGGLNGTPNYEDSNVVIRPDALGLLVDYAEFRGAIEYDSQFYAANSLGHFDEPYPDDETFCSIPDLEAASVSLPAIDEVLDDPATPDEDESLPAQPAYDITYKWTNARWVVSADAQGTQFEADLEYTENGCMATYHVVGLYPAVGCATDDECTDDHSGINPAFAVRCNTDLGLCVVDGDLPAYE